MPRRSDVFDGRLFRNGLIGTVVSASLFAVAAHGQCLPLWRFGPQQAFSGASGTVQSMTIGDPDGPGPVPRSLIVGGVFSYAGTVRSSSVAYYNPTTGWGRMGRETGSGENIWSLTTWNNTILAAGGFGSLNPATAALPQPTNIAAWNGTQWVPLSATQFNVQVQSVASFGGTVYVGSRSSSLPSVRTLYRYEPGATISTGAWTPLLPDVNGSVARLVVHNNELYMVGSFYRTATPATRFQVAKLNASGTDLIELPALSTTGSTMNGAEVYRGELYVYGQFNSGNGAPLGCNGIAKLHAGGNAWIPSTPDPSNTLVGQISSITASAVVDGVLYLGSADATRPLAWLSASNGVWSLQPGQASSGLPANTISAMSPDLDGRSVAMGGTGSFDHILPTSAMRLATWDRAGNRLAPIGAEGFSDAGLGYPFINASVVWNDALYLGGSFGGVGTQRGRTLARWDGTDLTPVAGAPSGDIARLFVGENGGALYSAGGTSPLVRSTGGAFTALTDSAGGTYASGVSSVSSLVDFGGSIVVGGSFTGSGGRPSYLMRRTGTTWAAIGSDSPNNAVTALTTWSHPTVAGGVPLLVATGSFTQIGSLAARVAAWDGTTWRALGQPSFATGFGSSPPVAIVNNNGELYWIAYIVQFGGASMYPISLRYDPGTDRWVDLPRPVEPVASGFGQPSSAIAASGSLWITSNYTQPGVSGAVVSLLRWDGTRWTGYGGATGLFAQVNSVAYFRGDPVITGLFGTVGATTTFPGVTSVGWARLALGGEPPVVSQQPTNLTLCNGGTANYFVAAAGTPPYSYRWQRVDGSGVATDLSNGTIPGTSSVASQTDMPTLRIANSDVAVSAYEFRCVIRDACGEVISDTASLRICVADVDDGSSSGVCDGGVTIDDLLYYLEQFGQGTLRADVDDGSSSGTPDGGVTIDDLLYFLTRFDAGC